MKKTISNKALPSWLRFQETSLKWFESNNFWEFNLLDLKHKNYNQAYDFDKKEQNQTFSGIACLNLERNKFQQKDYLYKNIETNKYNDTFIYPFRYPNYYIEKAKTIKINPKLKFKPKLIENKWSESVMYDSPNLKNGVIRVGFD